MIRLLVALSVCLVLGAGDARAQASRWETAATRVVLLTKDRSAAVRLDAAASQIVVAQPDIAEIVATTDRSFYVRGKQIGVTNILVYNTARQLSEVIDVKVGYDLDGLRTDLRSIMPAESIRVVSIGGGVLLAGETSTSTAATRAFNLAERYAPKQVSSQISVRDAEQIILEVRIIEASRSALKDFGINARITGGSGMFTSGTSLIGNNPPQGSIVLSGSVGGAGVDLALQALEEKGVIRTLARPNLAALSGEEASFLAGGEYPYPVPDAKGQVTIEFKSFGVKLNFQPIIEDGGLIRLKVAPEVSALDPRQSLKLGGFEVPALVIRRAATTVKMRPGETFAVAGLFQQDYSNAVRQIPWASDVPILGVLFKSARWRRAETELVILVTPRLATAEESIAAAPSPVADSREYDPIQMILDNQVLDKPMQKRVGDVPPPIKLTRAGHAP